MARWACTPCPLAAPSLRVVSYNILFDAYCTSRFGRTQIYPFCTPDMLQEKQRAQRQRRELMSYNADLICLQECGQRIFQSFFLPSFQLLGYEGLYFSKTGRAWEGCGIFYRRDRFKVEQSSCVPLNMDTLQQQHADIAVRVAAHPELAEALKHMTAIGVGLRLTDGATGRVFVLANTHLFYHADACHIRVLQAYMHLHQLHRLSKETSSDPECPIIFCGDCNCTHGTATYRLLTTGQVESDHHSWEKGKKFWWGSDRQLGGAPDDDVEGEKVQTETVPPPPPPFGEVFFHEWLEVPLRLEDTYVFCSEPLPWTNYTRTFKEVIDYIMVTAGAASVLQAVPIPPESELKRNVALPNEIYASDHIALITDLRWRDLEK